MIVLFLASQNRVLDADILEQTEAMFTVSAGLFGLVGKLDAVLNGLLATSISEVETFVT